MALLKDGRLQTDPYLDVSGQEDWPDDGALLVGLDQWQERREELLERDEPLGIRLRSDQKPDNIAADLEHFALVALEFPVFKDGRAYSYARLLRERYGFDGELRAVGDVLLEQLQFMHRVGFNSFVIDSPDAVRDWETAIAEIGVWYQPAADDRTTVIQKRHVAEPVLKKSCA